MMRCVMMTVVWFIRCYSTPVRCVVELRCVRCNFTSVVMGMMVVVWWLLVRCNSTSVVMT